MSKFIIGINQNNVANQIAKLLNNNNKLKKHYTSSKILSNNVTYYLELGSEKKIIGTVGYSYLSKEFTLIKHLSILEKYRNRGIATSLLKQVINFCTTEYIQMKVRYDNSACLNLAEKFNFVYICHETISDYHVLVLGRKVSEG